MRVDNRGNLTQLKNKLQKMRQEVPQAGKQWARETAQNFYHNAYQTLSNQGRPNGTPPPLSPMTRQIYSVDGEPDGSGIRNHMRIVEQNQYDGYQATFGILEGEPTKIARIQNYGATYTVTQDMRDFFAARYGIYLSPNTTVIHVPGRHFLDIASDQTKRHAKESFDRLFNDIK